MVQSYASILMIRIQGISLRVIKRAFVVHVYSVYPWTTFQVVRASHPYPPPPPPQSETCLQFSFQTLQQGTTLRSLLKEDSHFNPLKPNSDQHQISPCNINTYSTPEVMRIKDMITQGEFS